MAGKQEYNQACPIASALDVVGSRWAMLVVRELSLGPRRFGDISDGLETASTDMLTSRLRELEAAGLVARSANRHYELTAMGFALAPVMRSMLIWSLRSGAFEGVGADGSPRSIGPDPTRRLVGLLGLIARTTSIDADDRVVALNAEHLEVTVTRGVVGYQLREGAPEQDAAGTITFTLEGLLMLIVEGTSLDALLKAGHVSVDNSTAKAVLADLASAVSAAHSEIAQPVA